MNKNDLRYIKTEGLIRSAFLTSVDEVGFNETTVSHICDIAKISRFTFYTHYNDKYHLKDHILADIENNMHNSQQPKILFQALSGNILPGAERIVKDVLENKEQLRIMLLCDRNSVIDFLMHIYFDEPTEQAFPLYSAKLKSSLILQLSRAYLINALIGFVEVVVNQKEDLPAEELIDLLNTLCNQPCWYFYQQIKNVTLVEL